MNSLRHLTGFRGIAALLVVFYHIRSYIVPYVSEEIIYVLGQGYLAVDFFFILSGFVIAYNYFDKLVFPAKQSIVNFYIKRIARIYPLHFLVLMTYLMVPVAYKIVDKPFFFAGKYTIEGFISGLFLIQTWGWIETVTWNVPAWSISTELFAYILFPLMVLILKPLNKRYGLVGILTIVTILTYLMAVLFDEFGNENIGQNIQLVGIYRCVSEFFIGVCTWLVYRNYETKSFHLGALLFYGGIGFFLILSFTEIKNHYYVPILMATILLGSISQNNIFTSIFSSHFFVWLGDISYSIYLTHYLIRDFFKLLFLDTANASLYWIASYVLVVIFISHFLYKYFEMPSKQFILKRTLTKAKLL